MDEAITLIAVGAGCFAGGVLFTLFLGMAFQIHDAREMQKPSLGPRQEDFGIRKAATRADSYILPTKERP